MSRIWNFCINQNINEENKVKVFLAANTALFGLLGLLVWAVVSLFALKDISWMFCFAGYAAFVPGFLGGIFFVWKHDRKDLCLR